MRIKDFTPFGISVIVTILLIITLVLVGVVIYLMDMFGGNNIFSGVVLLAAGGILVFTGYLLGK